LHPAQPFQLDRPFVAGVEPFAACKHAAAAWMWNIKIWLHHRTGAADFATDERAEIGREAFMDGVLNEIALRFGLRRGTARKRCERRAMAAGGGDGFCGRERVIHRRRFFETQVRDAAR
jgi:hypothetical protein